MICMINILSFFASLIAIIGSYLHSKRNIEYSKINKLRFAGLSISTFFIIGIVGFVFERGEEYLDVLIYSFLATAIVTGIYWIYSSLR